MASVWDYLLGREERIPEVSVMQPGPVRTERSGDGLLKAVSEPLQYAPGPIGTVAGVGNAIAEGETGLGLLSAAALKSGPNKMEMVIGRGAKGANKLPKYGWFKGPDKVDRQEISDQGSNLLKRVGKETVSEHAKDVLDHEDLYNMYPELRNVKIRAMEPKHADEMFTGKGGDPLLEGYRYGGGLTPDGKTIQINPNLSPAAQRAVILHEMQHWVQKREGMAGGVSNVASAIAASKMYNEWKDIPSAKLKEQIKEEMKKKGLDITNPTRLKEQLYHKSYGEVEARATANRANMGPEARVITSLQEDYDTVPILWGQVSKQAFGRNVLDEVVDPTTNGTPGGSVSEAIVRKLLRL